MFKQMLRFLYTDELVRSWAGLCAFRERAFIVLFGLAIPGILLFDLSGSNDRRNHISVKH